MTTALAPLWQISEDLQALLESVETCPEDLLPELQAKIDQYLGHEAAKVDQVAHVLAALDYEQRCATDEIARLADRKRAAKAAQDRLEAYVCRVICARGVKQLKGDTNTLSVRPSDAVVFTDKATIPAAYRRVTATVSADVWEWLALAYYVKNAEWPAAESTDTIDKAAIKKALKTGVDVPGADLEYRDNLQRK